MPDEVLGPRPDLARAGQAPPFDDARAGLMFFRFLAAAGILAVLTVVPGPDMAVGTKPPSQHTPASEAGNAGSTPAGHDCHASDRQHMLTAMSMLADLDQAVRGADPDAGLRAVARLRTLVEQLEAEQVSAARQNGWSWRDIALRLGVTKQTVHRKYHRVEGA
jgi:hypothetical protein